MFENVIIDQLKKCGLEFQTHCREVAGTPDIVQISRRRAIFLDSDFWHGWRYPVWAASLKSDFWRQKIERNRKRDRLIMTKLRRSGWSVIRIWEHELGRDFAGSVEKMREFLLKTSTTRPRANVPGRRATAPVSISPSEN